MSIPLSYTWRNLAARKLTTLLTACGMALVVFVFATVLMLEDDIGVRHVMLRARLLAGDRRGTDRGERELRNLCHE